MTAVLFLVFPSVTPVRVMALVEMESVFVHHLLWEHPVRAKYVQLDVESWNVVVMVCVDWMVHVTVHQDVVDLHVRKMSV